MLERSSSGVYIEGGLMLYRWVGVSQWLGYMYTLGAVGGVGVGGGSSRTDQWLLGPCYLVWRPCGHLSGGLPAGSIRRGYGRRRPQLQDMNSYDALLRCLKVGRALEATYMDIVLWRPTPNTQRQ